MLHHASIDTIEMLTDSGVDFGDVVKSFLAQAGEDPTLRLQYPAFRLGFVLGLAAPCGNDGGPVVPRPLKLSSI